MCYGPAKQVVQCNNYPCPGKDLSWIYGRGERLNMKKWCQYRLNQQTLRMSLQWKVQWGMLFSYVLFIISVDCVWTDFNYTDCSHACGGGTRVGRRSFLIPAKYGGQSCYGPSEVTENCNNYPCPGERLWICGGSEVTICCSNPCWWACSEKCIEAGVSASNYMSFQWIAYGQSLITHIVRTHVVVEIG